MLGQVDIDYNSASFLWSIPLLVPTNNAMLTGEQNPEYSAASYQSCAREPR